MRKVYFCVLALCLFFSSAEAQWSVQPLLNEKQYYPVTTYYSPKEISIPIAKLYQRNRGMILGLQRGSVTSIELGGEAHWRKISLRKPHIIGATANLEYNFGHHVLGYKAGVWMKRGRVNLTYGANAAYFTDFQGRNKVGIGPAVGFRLLGFHLINGYNFLVGNKDLDKVNTLYITLRYYFPVENKFEWDKRDKNRKIKEREKKKKAKEKAKKKKLKQKGQENDAPKKGIWKLFEKKQE